MLLLALQDDAAKSKKIGKDRENDARSDKGQACQKDPDRTVVALELQRGEQQQIRKRLDLQREP